MKNDTAKKEYQAKWRAANAEKVRGYCKKWREANREKAREACRESRLKNPDYAREWASANKEKTKQYKRKWLKSNPEKAKATRKAYELANPEKILTARRKWKEANPEKMLQYQHNRRVKLGLPHPTREEPSFCECCGDPPGAKGLHLDHCHQTGKFRGWLCGSCNLGVGSLGDTLLGVQNMLDYLTRAQDGT